MLSEMTRCLDCGAERDADQCASCGLTAAAAELVFRRKLIYRTLVFLAGFVPLPWILTVILFVNGKFDTPKRIEYVPATVRDTFYMKGIVRGSRRLVVNSWRPGRKFERIPVEVDDYERFRVGDSLEVAVEPGIAGIPWVYGVYRKGPPRP